MDWWRLIMCGLLGWHDWTYTQGVWRPRGMSGVVKRYCRRCLKWCPKEGYDELD